jgi:hypothetical protein
MSRAPKSLCEKPQKPLPHGRGSLSPTIRIRAIRAVTVRERKLKPGRTRRPLVVFLNDTTGMHPEHDGDAGLL